MSSWHLILRRSAVSCLRQLAQKEAPEVCSIAAMVAKKKLDHEVKRGVIIGDTGMLYIYLIQRLYAKFFNIFAISLAFRLVISSMDLFGFKPHLNCFTEERRS